MAAGGTRGDLIAGGTGGFALAFKADALWVGTSIDGTDGPAGRLKATGASVTRFRTGLEGSRDYNLGDVLALKPVVEVGLRHDGGDAETGAGMDIGGGVTVASPTGLAVDLRVRMLLVHQAEGFLQPDAVDTAGLDGQGGAVVGRTGHGRRAGAVGPRDDGGARQRRLRGRQPARQRGRLRSAARQPLRGNAARRPDDPSEAGGRRARYCMRSFQCLADDHHVDDAGNLIACSYVDFRDPTERSPITTLKEGLEPSVGDVGGDLLHGVEAEVAAMGDDRGQQRADLARVNPLARLLEVNAEPEVVRPSASSSDPRAWWCGGVHRFLEKACVALLHPLHDGQYIAQGA